MLDAASDLFLYNYRYRHCWLVSAWNLEGTHLVRY